MATEIVLPQWGMEMLDGTIVKWLKREGDPVEEGEPIVEVETAKIETELESTATGILVYIMVAEGTNVPVRTLLAIVADPGEDVPRPGSAAPSGQRSGANPRFPVDIFPSPRRGQGSSGPGGPPSGPGAWSRPWPGPRNGSQGPDFDRRC